MKKIGITTTVPIEILISAGYRVIDLNNIFIMSRKYSDYIEFAEKDGFPRSSCAFKKGVYGAAIANDFLEIIGVTEGDCSNSKALEEVFRMKGIKVYPFAYPSTHKLSDLKHSIDKFMNYFNVNMNQVEVVRKKLNNVRTLVKKIDELTYIDNKATALENHIYQVSCSDFNGNFIKFEKELEQKISEIESRKPIEKKLRLAYIGTPPMTLNIYEFVENFDARFVYNEVQREFAFPRGKMHSNIYEQYYDYTYPYNIEFRIEEIKKQIKERKIDGIINYTQSFCYRQIEHIIIKEALDIPILNVEGDKLNALDARTKLRIEAFLDMLIDMR
ncbi:Benzoyl-CoA reductase/2-hydroxyglutaryl-CoA dehydratase subunit, BcrC/BadD/HgdB [Clostridium acidisoli DSM 12555]|uniref:Benzoyl-CoA reductase/2-hydroxyglutaryl-CoA dehydratase subunit, BcrC/BadD/HgdB n=1 Tax=Clostridium acidisoli DSM 12555 TaxID=1121291 RepID=A0A1W1X9P1_9CLOT|nr:2-hydroxyacyl-CoA dehydratase [Clostridium acidisoli]SMC20725.1 Benzoyl-CoA reductase/2-hydroxyglutaryl-CoA dehydratase subunit, BcrC/BadD/HgdB [Clostridium acidisoli DSM 12555]